MGLTVVVPFWHGHAGLSKLLASIPKFQSVIVVNDFGSPTPDISQWGNVRVVNLTRRGYFSGACNAGFAACETDVLILNQDGALLPGWQQALVKSDRYALIGDGVMAHPAYPKGYIQGTFMFVRRDLIDAIGGFNTTYYPLWGATCEYQLRACRAGFEAKPMNVDAYFEHTRGHRSYGTSIARALKEDPRKKPMLIRTPPAVSVVITVYNFGRYLEQAVQSVLDQTFQGTEIIIVDDGSTDNTPEIGQALADPWKGITYYRQRNSGASAAANAGIERAHGKFITVLDGDDYMAPDRLARMLAMAHRNPHSVVYDDVTFVIGNKRLVRSLPDYQFERLLEQNCMHKGILYPKAAWRQVGGYSTRMNDGREDWEFNIRLGLAGWCGVHLQEPLYQYRREHQGRTQRAPKSRQYFLDKITALHRAVYFQGERPMGCCGGRRTKPRTVTVQRTPVQQETFTAVAPASDWVVLVYTGTSIGNQTLFGPTRTRYKYGRNARNLRVWVHPDDVAFMLSTGEFKRANLPKPPAPTPTPGPTPPEPEPEPEPEPVDDDEPLPEPPPIDIPATRYAVDLAEQYGVDLADVPHRGDRVTKSDVEAYLAGLA